MSIDLTKPPLTAKPQVNPIVVTPASGGKWQRLIPFVWIGMLLTVGIIVAREIQKPKSLISRATTGSAKVFVVPTESSIPPASVFQVWVTTDRPTAFVHTVIHFDQQHLLLTGPVSFANAPLSRVVQQTTETEANSSGNIVIATALAPENRDNPPTNTFLLASFTLASRTQNPNVMATVSPQGGQTQIVQPDGELFTITTQTSQITLNKNESLPVETPTDVPSVTPSATPTPIPQDATISPTLIAPTTTPTLVAASHTPSPIPTPTFSPHTDLAFLIRVRLQGVTNDNATGADATVRFVKGDLDLITEPIAIEYAQDGHYLLRFTVNTDLLTPGNGYTIIIKGEKHIAVKYCLASGQTTNCQPAQSLTIPEPNGVPITFDFTGLPLAPGDLQPQDGIANLVDFENLQTRMSILCDELTIHDRQVADVNYNGCIDSLDAFWMRNTLETRYDEN